MKRGGSSTKKRIASYEKAIDEAWYQVELCTGSARCIDIWVAILQSFLRFFIRRETYLFLCDSSLSAVF
jgi:hypothetical protein